eukprot:1146249-Pelagomonas_calceolata.AAC.4
MDTMDLTPRCWESYPKLPLVFYKTPREHAGEHLCFQQSEKRKENKKKMQAVKINLTSIKGKGIPRAEAPCIPFTRFSPGKGHTRL